MTIRRTEGPKPTIRPTAASEAQSKTAAKPATITPNVIKDGFGPAAKTSDLARAEKTLKPLPPPVGRLSLDSREAQTAIQASLAHLAPTTQTSIRNPGIIGGVQFPAYTPKSVERDSLGMTHVRLDRQHEGVKVFGEQVVTHLDSEGKVKNTTGDQSEIPAGLGTQKPKVTHSQALDIAMKAFDGKPDRQPNSERVIYKDISGEYHSAYRVEVTNVDGTDNPRKMNYLVDANTGKLFEQFNAIDGFARQRGAAHGHSHAEGADHADHAHSAAATPSEIKASATPKAEIADLTTVTSKINVTQDGTVDQLKLDLDIDHTFKGDLSVTLTSPSGKSETVHNRKGGSADHIKGSFDLSGFAGESAKGEWTLSVKDNARRDTGTLNSWGLTITPKAVEPNEPGPGEKIADDTSMYSGKVALETKKQADGTYTLEDGTRGKGVATYDAMNRERASGQTPIKDNNDVWGEATDPERNKAAVDAHYGGQMMYDYMKDILGRDSIDGAGEKLVSYVHVSNNYVNAYWDGEKMSYGDGDGRNSGPLTALDIAGHEIAHGLTERTAGLIYRGESGGLNEAMSDIMGAGLEWYASQKNPDVKFNWTVGETAWTPTDGDPTDGLRYMDDPTKDKYSIDNYKNYPKQTEVHGSSGIANNAFYLLTNGGTNRTSGVEVKDAIGMEKGLKIYYRALAHYMTPSTTFAQARTATINAATDLYGADSAEVAKVKESWTAVGVN
ncbi:MULTISPECIES: M4 family metallopeptidase [Myxococcus]|uniref:Peptidase M4 n=1 Tax=Myxococcus xanthus TaxID=34 RepID=A0AAE6FYV7_MYXXA|nr:MULTISPECIES: M4 family metallopeptidase [Myxococcus]QDE67880.1 peptidase M4 [Myxococcus xanthus]QDE75157.1 peptidase M4 [Myxococcus xanthus]QDE82430.1 peptidase M4 [Myxococcus xanthus]WAM29187.1 M4 family metallopeptidase [Myxococcus sp. NMCA1]